MTVEETLPVTVEIISALGFLHYLGYAHRDIKRNNIMFREDGTVMVGRS